MQAPDHVPAAVLAAWSFTGARVQSVAGGHINRTWCVEQNSRRWALQWLNPIFAPEVNLDIDALTRRLTKQGLLTARLVPTSAANKLWIEYEDGGCWRALTWIDGEVVLQADGPDRCHAAGELLGRWHAALWSGGHDFAFRRAGVHDTVQHLEALRRALQEHSQHHAIDNVTALAGEIFSYIDSLDWRGDLPQRLVHGDPKISNIVFDARGQGLCLIDLDTFNLMPIAVELGDAFRSWCSPAGEDQPARFELAYFEAGLRGYAKVLRGRPKEPEWRAIPDWTQIICLELAARFAADALCESYFNWDRSRFASASTHNVQRARSQLELARSIAAQKEALHRINAEIWTSGQDI